MSEQAIDELALIGVQKTSRVLDGYEFRAVDLPRRTVRNRVRTRRAGETVHGLAAARVRDRTKRNEIAGFDARLLHRFAHCGLFERFSGFGQPLGDAPRRTTIVAAGRVHDQDLEHTVTPAVEQRTRGKFQSSTPDSLISNPIWLT